MGRFGRAGRAWSLLAAALAAAALGCRTAPAPPAPDPRPPPQVTRVSLLPPGAWPKTVRERFPAGPVAVETRGYDANGVVIHSCDEHGTFVLTNEHVAESVAEASEAWVRVPDLGSGELRAYRAEPFLPDRETLIERGRRLRNFLEIELEGAGERLMREVFSGLVVRLQRAAQGDLAVLVVHARGDRLAVAPVALLDPGEESYRVVSLHPDPTPRERALLDSPHRTFHPRVEKAGAEGISGSGVFDRAGRVHALATFGPGEIEPDPDAGPPSDPRERMVEAVTELAEALEDGAPLEQIEPQVAALLFDFRYWRRIAATRFVGVTQPAQIEAWLQRNGLLWLLEP